MKKLLLIAGLLLGVVSPAATVASPPATAPEFTGIVKWFNSPPLTLAGLRGKVVLIDFWAYSCINCIRAMPHVEHLYETYKDKGLVVVGVHSPEFEFERNPTNVKAAMRRLGITHPVALDTHMSTWNAWRNQAWPAEYLIDQNGQVIGHHYGEGDYDKMENAIRLLLGLDMLPKDSRAEAVGLPPDSTPELHLGRANQHGFDDSQSGSEGIRRFSVPARLALHRFALNGTWEIAREYARSLGVSELHLRFKAARLYMVASAESPVALEVMVDGAPQPAVTVHESRLYTLFESREADQHTLVLRIPQADLRVYSFTFGAAGAPAPPSA